MSALRFTIIENDPITYTSIDSSVVFPYVIDEPVGLDSINLHLKRDDHYHGFLDAVDDSLGALKFYNKAYSILKYAYTTYGMEAKVSLLIEYACDDRNTFDPLYQGTFSFDKYKEVQGLQGCYVEASIENGQALTLFRNRMDTRISLDATSAMGDGYTDGAALIMPKYPALGMEVMLNPMLMDLVDYGKIATSGDGSISYSYVYTDSATDVQTCPDNPSFFDVTPGDAADTNVQNNEFLLWYSQPCAVVTPFTTIQNQEFGDFTGTVGDKYENNGIPGSGSHSLTNHGWGTTNLSDPSPVFEFSTDLIYESTMINIDIELSGAVIAGHLLQHSVEGTGICTPEINVGVYKGQSWSDVAGHGGNHYNFAMPNASTNRQGCIINMTTLINDHVHGVTGNSLQNETPNGTINYLPFQYSFHASGATSVQFNPGDKLWVLVELTHADSITPHVVFFSGSYTYRNSYDSSWFNSGATITPASGFPTPATSGPSTASGGGHVVTLTRDIISVPGSPAQSYIKLSFPSLFQATPATTYMVNESLSRITEATTNGALCVYSDYFGRTDAQPYSSAADGPGGLECITTGLLIRGYSPLAALQMSTSSPTTTPIPFSGYPLTYTLDATTDLYTSSSANVLLATSGGTIIIPPDISSTFSIGAQVIIQQGGVNAALVTGGTYSCGSGTCQVSVVSSSGTSATFGQGSQVLLTKVGENSWLLSSRSTMSVSFKELFEALHAIHAVGFGDEDDLRRPNGDGTYQKLIRIEPIEHFYDATNTMLTCENVDVVETNVDTHSIINVFKSGYHKWEAEEAQGLDEFLSRRFFRTTLHHVRNAWDKVCKFVASGYAIEATRRKLGTDTTDWRFDNDNFIICLDRGAGADTGSGATISSVNISGGHVTGITLLSGGSGYTVAPEVTISYGGYTTQATATAVVSGGVVTGITITNPGAGYYYTPTVTITPGTISGGFSSEQGNAKGGPPGASGASAPAQGMINADTVYNYRISPVRNALRWLRYIISSYSDWTRGELIFESGGGNYTAVGYNNADSIDGRALSESDTLSMGDYHGNKDVHGTNTALYAVKPIYKHELVKFRYPLSYADWKYIFNNKYGLIKYSVNDGDYQYGYVHELKYNLIEGIGEFTLRPQLG